MLLYVRDKSFKKIGRPIRATSVVWLRKAKEEGQIAFTVDATSEMLGMLKQDYYITRDDDEMVGVIKQLTINTDAETDINELQVVCVDVLSILDTRILYKMKTFSGSVELAIRELIEENFINPIDSNGEEYLSRQIPIILGDLANISDVFDVELPVGTNIGETIKTWCLTYDICIKVIRDADKWKVVLYKGTNRSISQMDNPIVEFSDQFHNVKTTQYIMDCSNAKNMALVGGEEIEGVDRLFVKINDGFSGLERKEIFVDASSLKQENDDGNRIPDDTYKSIITQYGVDQLSEYVTSESFACDIINTKIFNYKKHYELGDIVTTRSEYGLLFNARVVQVKEAYDDNGLDITLTLEYREVN